MDLANLITPEAISERLAFHQRLTDEESDAAALCERVLTGPSSWWTNALRNAAGSRTAGVVTVLLGRARERTHQSPADALLLAQLADEVATVLDVDDYPYDHVLKVRGQALRDVAWFLSTMGRFEEASENVDRAAHFLKQIPMPDVELARLDLVRSNIARFTDHYDEAIAYARRAAESFLWFGDRGRWVAACDYEAGAHFARHEFARALEVWQAASEYLDPEDAVGRARTLHHMAMCHRETGGLKEAGNTFRGAAEVFGSLGMEVERVKCVFSLGITLMMEGDYGQAVPMLRASFDALESLGLHPDATLAGLRLVEALMITKQDREVPAICRLLIERCTRTGMKSRAMTALAFLRETLATGHATPESVRSIHDYLRDTTVKEKRLFARLE